MNPLVNHLRKTLGRTPTVSEFIELNYAFDGGFTKFSQLEDYPEDCAEIVGVVEDGELVLDFENKGGGEYVVDWKEAV